MHQMYFVVLLTDGMVVVPRVESGCKGCSQSSGICGSKGSVCVASRIATSCGTSDKEQLPRPRPIELRGGLIPRTKIQFRRDRSQTIEHIYHRRNQLLSRGVLHKIDKSKRSELRREVCVRNRRGVCLVWFGSPWSPQYRRTTARNESVRLGCGSKLIGSHGNPENP
jgi:hypothetical protein